MPNIVLESDDHDEDSADEDGDGDGLMMKMVVCGGERGLKEKWRAIATKEESLIRAALTDQDCPPAFQRIMSDDWMISNIR